jgi:hypothetical protein
MIASGSQVAAVPAPFGRRVTVSPNAVGCAVLALAALAVRAHQLHRGLIYPDGYQYLLMARGIAAHLTPTLQLGHGGELFVPTLDSALKPLFPALIALLSPLAGIRSAAELLTVAAGAATVVLAGMLAGRLTGSRIAGAVAAIAALTSPVLAYWSGFIGPDPLADALGLATALAVLERRATLAGLLGGLCACTRPEWSVVLLGAGLAALARPRTRASARTSLLTAAFTLAIVIGGLRPPLAAPKGGLGLLLAAVAAATALQLGAVAAAGTVRRATLAVTAGLVGLAVVAVSGRVAAAGPLLREDWPALALAAVGLLRACSGGRGRPALLLLASATTLGAAYVYRNAGSERYLAELLPLAAVAAGFVAAPVRAGEAAALRRRLRTLATAVRVALPAAVLGLGAVLVAPRPALAPDLFARLAPQLAHEPAGTLISAAPDAYGLLLPDRSQARLRPGARGLILLDGAQRAYDAGLTASGVVLVRLSAPQGFERPDGTLDTGPVLLVRGVVVSRPGSGR